MSPELQAFVQEVKINYSLKKIKPITIESIIKHHNHELWRVCLHCGETFDARKEVHWDRCPKCNSKNIR